MQPDFCNNLAKTEETCLIACKLFLQMFGRNPGQRVAIFTSDWLTEAMRTTLLFCTSLSRHKANDYGHENLTFVATH